MKFRSIAKETPFVLGGIVIVFLLVFAGRDLFVDFLRLRGVSQNIREENTEALRVSVSNLSLRNDSLTLEIKELKAQLKFVESRPDVVATGYLFNTRDKSPYGTYLTDAGKSSGVKVGDIVSVDGVIALGYIISVSDNSSLLRLFSEVGEETAIRLEGPESFELVGNGAGGFTLEIPSTLEAPNILVLARDPSLIIARVEAQEEDQTRALDILSARMPVNPAHVSLITILRGSR